MNYEQKYNEALERAKDFFKANKIIGKLEENDMLSDIFPELKESEEKMKDWLEKQGEQKPVDKIEPKFKTGQWIVWQDKCYKVNYNGCGYELVLLNGLSTSLEYGAIDESAHLWTIEDAKDGDVLCTYECGNPKIIFILKGTPKKPYVLRYYCYYNIMYPYFESDSETGCIAPNEGGVKPATKEQCDQLRKAMFKAGYEWDAENRELKKL